MQFIMAVFLPKEKTDVVGTWITQTARLGNERYTVNKMH